MLNKSGTYTSGQLHCSQFWPFMFHLNFPAKNKSQNFESLSFALLISRYILGLGQRWRCCFCAACPNRKMYLKIRSTNEGANMFSVLYMKVPLMVYFCGYVFPITLDSLMWTKLYTQWFYSCFFEQGMYCFFKSMKN